MQRTFHYTAYTLEGLHVRGRRTGTSEREIRLQLEEEALEVERVVSRPWDVNLGLGARRVGTKELMVFTRMLSALLRSGVTTSQALEVLYRQTSHETFRRHILDISMAVRKGMRLSDAMKQHPRVFPAIYTEIVVAGEKSGNLDRMLNRLAVTLARTHQITSKVKMACTYPGILLATVLIVGALMLYYIIPEFASIFEKGGYELPRITVVLLGLSDLLREFGSVLLVALIAAVPLLPRVRTVPQLQDLTHRVLLRLPVIGDLALTGAMATYCRVMAMTLSSGVVVVDALRLAAETVPNRRIAAALRQSHQEVATGSRLASALERTRVVPPLIVAVTAVGEKSGELDEQYEMTADFYEEQVLYAVDRTLKLLEPALIILVFGGVAVLLLAVYTPLFRSIAIMGG